MPVRACVFDAYGTLFDVNERTVARRAAGRARLRVWPSSLADLWRTQAAAVHVAARSWWAHHADFWQVTQDGARLGDGGAGAGGCGAPGAAAGALPGACRPIRRCRGCWPR